MPVPPLPNTGWGQASLGSPTTGQVRERAAPGRPPRPRRRTLCVVCRRRFPMRPHALADTARTHTHTQACPSAPPCATFGPLASLGPSSASLAHTAFDFSAGQGEKRFFFASSDACCVHQEEHDRSTMRPARAGPLPGPDVGQGAAFIYHPSFEGVWALGPASRAASRAPPTAPARPGRGCPPAPMGAAPRSDGAAGAPGPSGPPADARTVSSAAQTSSS